MYRHISRDVHLLVALILLTSCTSPWTSASSPLKTPLPTNDTVITLERTVCFGWCPAYTLTIHGDGQVTYEGYAYVDVEGVRTSNISQSKIHELLYEFGKVDFFAANEHYSIGATDLPTFFVTLAIGNRQKRIEHYGCDPQWLTDLEYMIDTVAETEQWIGENAYQKHEKLNCADFFSRDEVPDQFESPLQ